MMDSTSRDYLESLNKLLHQKDRAADLIETVHQAEGTKLSKRQRRSLQALRQASTPLQLVSSGVLLNYVPLLGALSRNDINQTDAALKMILNAERASKSRDTLFPSYWSITAAVCFVMLAFQACYVMPNFETMFADFQLRTSFLTQIVFALNRFVRANVVFIGLALGALYVAGTTYWSWRDKLIVALSRSPMFGEFFLGNDASVRKASEQTLISAELIEQGMPVKEAVLTASGIHEKNGSNTKTYLLSLPNSVVHIARQSLVTKGDIQQLRDLSQIYSERIQLTPATWNNASYLQLSVILLGVFVLITVLSLFLPLLSLITSLS